MTSVTYPEAMGACDVVMARNSVFGGCWRRVKAQSYRDEYVRAVGPHGRHLPLPGGLRLSLTLHKGNLNSYSSVMNG